MSKIAVYAGHGGTDFGAISNGLYEKDINLELLLALTSELRRRGYEVINNRTTDVNRNLGADIRRANSQDVDAVVELHVNSNMGIPGSGTETYYSVTGKGKELAEAIQTNLVALGFRDRGIKVLPNIFGGDYLGIIRETEAPAVLVETFFLNNPQDLSLYDPQKIALEIADAIGELYPVTSLKDDQIAKIQTTLNTLYEAGLVVDGIYGPRTKRALIKGLQRELNTQFNAGLLVDGIFGPKTKNALVNVRRGARGNITYLIQSALYILGYDVIPDKIFGVKTERAVRSFQQENGLNVSGEATREMQNKLFSSI
ncbi:MAG: N-acetylmuramoyl-L-alanine amidase [Clostridia bacterium]|nr:N-acetylmuramoyl-L-alanine amidase [Clostridia bacterium]